MTPMTPPAPLAEWSTFYDGFPALNGPPGMDVLPSDDETVWVVSVSGGKDSDVVLKVTVDLLGAGRIRGELHAMHWHTDNETPETYRQLRWLSDNVHPIRFHQYRPEGWDGSRGYLDLVRARQRFPGGGGGRWCSGDMKIKANRQYCNRLKRQGRNVIVVTGYRAQEGTKRASMSPWVAFDDPADVIRFLPIQAWSSHDVMRFHVEMKMPWCEEYDVGRLRVGCRCCHFATKEGLRRWFTSASPDELRWLVETEREMRELNANATYFPADKASPPYRNVEIESAPGRAATVEYVRLWALGEQPPVDFSTGQFAMFASPDPVPTDMRDELADAADNICTAQGFCDVDDDVFTDLVQLRGRGRD